MATVWEIERKIQEAIQKAMAQLRSAEDDRIAKLEARVKILEDKLKTHPTQPRHERR